MEENEKKPLHKDRILTLIVALAGVAIIAGISILAFKLSGNSQNATNGANTTNTTNTTENTGFINDAITYETEHIIQDVKIKFVPKEDMLILTDSEIDQYMGAGYSQVYEIVSMNAEATKMLYCFVVDNSENIAEEQYIENALGNTEHEKIEKQVIAELEFSGAKLNYDEDGKQYIEECYVHKYDDKFLCIDYWHLSTEENSISEMFQKVE